MKVLNLLTAGYFGGIEIYCKDIAKVANYENGFCFMFGEGEVYEIMKEENRTVYSLVKYPRLSYQKLSELIKIVKMYDIIVIHHGDPFLETYYLILKMILPTKKYVRTIHACFENYKYENYGLIKSSLCNVLERWLMKESDLIITVSNAVQETFSSAFCMDKNKVVTVYNGIGEDKLLEGANVNIRKNEGIHLLYVGRLVKEKGVHLLLGALSKLKDVENIYLHIVGDGAAREELEKLSCEYEIEQHVVFEGFRSNVGDYLKKCDIFVSPTMYESFGISIVEAMAYKCVCVVNAVGGVPEIIKDGENGFLSEKPDVEHLLHAIERAICCIQSGEDEKIRRNARERAEYFSIKNTCNQLENHFQGLLI